MNGNNHAVRSFTGFYSLPVIGVIHWTAHAACMGETRNAYQPSCEYFMAVD
jgi:hypothetical protein